MKESIDKQYTICYNISWGQGFFVTIWQRLAFGTSNLYIMFLSPKIVYHIRRTNASSNIAQRSLEFQAVYLNRVYKLPRINNNYRKVGDISLCMK